MSIKSLTTLTVNLDSLLPKLPHASFLKADCNKPSPQAFTQQALAFVASQPAPRSNYSFSNNNLGQLLGMPFARSRSQRKAKIMTRLLSSFLGGNLYNMYRSAKSLKRFYNNNDNAPRALSLNLSREPSNYNSSRPRFSDLSQLCNALGSHFAFKHDDFKSSTQPMPLSITVKAVKKSTFDDDVRRLLAAGNAQSDGNCDKNKGVSLSLDYHPTENTYAAKPLVKTLSDDKKTATILAGGYKFDINQNEQRMTITDPIKNKVVTSSFGDPHITLPDGTTRDWGKNKNGMAIDISNPTTGQRAIVALSVEKQKGSNALETTKNITISDGTSAVKVRNVSGFNSRGVVGMSLENTSQFKAAKAVSRATNLIAMDGDKNGAYKADIVSNKGVLV